MLEDRDPRTFAIIGAAIDVHRELGPGFLEQVYHEALAIELNARAVPFVRERAIEIRYKGALLTTCYRADFLCFEEIIVELKSLTQLTRIESAQVLNYLKATGFELGLLLNFGAGSLERKRLIQSPSARRRPPE